MIGIHYFLLAIALAPGTSYVRGFVAVAPAVQCRRRPASSSLHLHNAIAADLTAVKPRVEKGPNQDAEWAGWECRFTAAGEKLPVPEDYLPESLKEWEVDVWGFETLTSERWTIVGNAGQEELYRKRARVYPEVGCALDNLSLEIRETSSPLVPGSFTAFASGGFVRTTAIAGSSCSTSLATAAAARSEGTPLALEVTLPTLAGWRTRVELAVLADGHPAGPVIVTRERRYREEFDGGTVYKGGGLDSQTLGRALGGATCFAETEAVPSEVELAALWTEWMSAGGWEWQAVADAAGSATAVENGAAASLASADGPVAAVGTAGGVTVRWGPLGALRPELASRSDADAAGGPSSSAVEVSCPFPAGADEEGADGVAAAGRFVCCLVLNAGGRSIAAAAMTAAARAAL